MADHLDGQLRRAGSVLDEWRSTNVTDGIPGDDRVVVRLHRADGNPRRRRDSVLLVAAVLLVVALAVVVLPQLTDDESTPVATTSAPVALVPPPDQEDGVFAVWEPTPLQWPDEHAVVIPDGYEGDPSEVVWAMQVPASATVGSDFEEVSGSGLTGRRRSAEPWGHVALVIDPTEGASETFDLRAGPGVTMDDLFEIAAALDPEVPFDDQSLDDGWQLIRPSEVRAPDAVVRRWVWADAETGERWSVSVVEDGGPYTPLSFSRPITEPGVRHEIRGHDAWVTVIAGRHVEAVWTDDQGLEVRLDLSPAELNPDMDEATERLVEVAESLVPVDEDGWEAFAAGVDPPSPSDGVEPPLTTAVGGSVAP